MSLFSLSSCQAQRRSGCKGISPSLCPADSDLLEWLPRSEARQSGYLLKAFKQVHLGQSKASEATLKMNDGREFFTDKNLRC